MTTLTATSPAAAPNRGRPRDDGRRAAILAAAVALLTEVGYERVSMDAIAARAQASKATLYRWWPGKAELVVDAIHSTKPDQEPAPDTGSLRGDCLVMVEQMVAAMASGTGCLISGLLLEARDNPELADLVRVHVLAGKRECSDAIVARAIDRGEISAHVTPRLFDAAPALALMRLLITGEPLDTRFSTWLVDTVLLPLFHAGPSTPPPV